MSQQRPKVNPLTDAERAVIAELSHIRDQLGWTDARFVKRLLNDYSYSAWIRCRKDCYTGDTRAALSYYSSKIADARGLMERDRTERPNLGEEPFFVTHNIRALLAAIDIARRRRNEKGLVMWIAPPGGGKSALLRHLQREYGARLTQATRAWRRSYCCGLQAVGQALGVSETFRSTHYLEQAVFQAAREMGHAILGIDDANTFGDHTCDMIRDLCNLTNLTIVTASTSIPFNQMNRSGYNEGEQMRRRAVAIIKADTILPEDVAPFFKAFGLNGDSDQALTAVADAANMYNRFDFVNSVVANLRLRYAGQKITHSEIAHAVGVEAKKLQRGPKVTK